MTERHGLKIYRTQEGRSPFADRLGGLRDRAAAARVRTRLARLPLGNFGDTRALGDGLHELRVDFGPGYRVYYARTQQRIVLLLCGGTKGPQAHDIQRALDYWRDYKERSQ